MSVLITRSDFESLAYEYFARAHTDGVLHAEVFFDPQAHTSRGVAYETVVQGFKTAQARAQRDFGMTSKLVLCFLRHLPVSDAMKTFDAADAVGHFSDDSLAGIGLDSSEKGFPPELFQAIYEKAAEKGIRRTAHAGEEGDVSYIRNALDMCRVERIDHGIRLREDVALMSRVAKQNTLVTVCPISNVQLRCVQGIKDLPIREFLDAGVRFSINSDDPAYFGGYILDNYCAVQDAFELSIAEWDGIAKAAIEGSWCDTARKEEMAERVSGCVTKFKN